MPSEVKTHKSLKYLWSRYKLVPKIPLKMAYALRKNKLPTVYHEGYDRKQVIYIHIPKTGGSSIGTALCGTDIIGHYPYSLYKSIDPIRFESYYKFCFVRDPIERFISAYYYLKYNGKGRSDYILRKHLTSDINEFVLGGGLAKIMMKVVHFVPQVDFIFRGYVCQLDEIFKIEDYESSIRFIEKKIGTTLPRLRENVAKDNLSSRITLCAEAIQMIRDVYKEDYLLLNYD